MSYFYPSQLQVFLRYERIEKVFIGSVLLTRLRKTCATIQCVRLYRSLGSSKYPSSADNSTIIFIGSYSKEDKEQWALKNVVLNTIIDPNRSQLVQHFF